MVGGNFSQTSVEAGPEDLFVSGRDLLRDFRILAVLHLFTSPINSHRTLIRRRETARESPGELPGSAVARLEEHHSLNSGSTHGLNQIFTHRVAHRTIVRMRIDKRKLFYFLPWRADGRRRASP